MGELRSIIKRDSKKMIQSSSMFKIESEVGINVRTYILRYARMITSFVLNHLYFDFTIPSSLDWLDEISSQSLLGLLFSIKTLRTGGCCVVPRTNRLLQNWWYTQVQFLVVPWNPEVLCFDATQGLGGSLPGLGALVFTIQLFFLKTANSSIWHRLGVGLSSLVILGPADFPILPTPGIYQCGLSFSVLLDVSSPLFLSYPSPLSLLSPSKNQISFSPRTSGLQKTRASDSDSFPLSAS